VRARVILLPLLLAVATTAQTFENLAAQADAARQANHLDRAASLYREALAMRPAWADGWWYLGTLLYDRDDYAGASQALEKAVQRSPKSGNATAMLGLCEARLGRHQDALEHLRKALALGVQDTRLRPVVLYTEGTLWLAAGEFAEAQTTLDQLIHEGSGQEEAIVALGQAVLGVRPEDMASADRATRDAVWQAGWAEHFAARGDVHLALAQYRKLAADFPQLHNVHFACGRFLLANHFDNEAVAAFRREIQNDPRHLLARLGIAGALAASDPAAGLPYAEQAVKLAPGLGEAHYLLGVLLLDTGSTARAIAELETARWKQPADTRVYFALVRAYSQAHRPADAARARAEFVRLNEENSK